VLAFPAKAESKEGEFGGAGNRRPVVLDSASSYGREINVVYTNG
jgi:hypothetical protein